MMKGGETTMVKKLAILAAALALATPAFAHWWGSDDVTVENKNTKVTNTVTTKADTGDNEVSGMFVRGGKISTGDASAYAQVTNGVNYTQVTGCGCFDDVTVKNKNTKVKNTVTTKADTGDNEVKGFKVGGWYRRGAKIYTGDEVASSVVWNDVNTTLVGDVE